MSLTKSVRFGLVIMVLFSANLGWASSLSDVEILERTAAQRTLVISAAKHYVLAAAGIDVEESKGAVIKAKDQFDQNLRLLKMNVPDTYARNGLKQLQQEWTGFRSLLEKQSSQAQVETIIEGTNKLVFLADNLANNWSGLPSSRELELVNLANFQAMLSERIGLLYAAHYYGVKQDWVVMELNETLYEYESSLDYLERFVGKDSSTVKHLEQVNNQWNFAKQGFAKFNQGHYLPKVIAVTVASMQQEMQQVASHYSQHYETNHDALVTLSIPGLAANLE